MTFLGWTKFKFNSPQCVRFHVLFSGFPWEIAVQGITKCVKQIREICYMSSKLETRYSSTIRYHSNEKNRGTFRSLWLQWCVPDRALTADWFCHKCLCGLKTRKVFFGKKSFFQSKVNVISIFKFIESTQTHTKQHETLLNSTHPFHISFNSIYSIYFVCSYIELASTKQINIYPDLYMPQWFWILSHSSPCSTWNIWTLENCRKFSIFFFRCYIVTKVPKSFLPRLQTKLMLKIWKVHQLYLFFMAIRQIFIFASFLCNFLAFLLMDLEQRK